MASPPSGTSPGLSSRASFLRETAAQLLGLVLSKVRSPGALPSELGALRALLGASSLLPCVLPWPCLPCSQASEAPLTGGFWGCRVNRSRLPPLPRKLQEPLFRTVQRPTVSSLHWDTAHPAGWTHTHQGTCRSAPPGVPDSPVPPNGQGLWDEPSPWRAAQEGL